MANINEKTIEAMNTAWNTKNAERIVEHFSDEISFEDPFTSTPIKGKTAVKGYLTGLFTAFPDFKVTVGKTVIQGNTAVALNTATATNTGPIQTPDGKKLAATGKKFVHEAAVYSEYDAKGKATKVKVYGDSATIFKQLGLPPPQ